MQTFKNTGELLKLGPFWELYICSQKQDLTSALGAKHTKKYI